MSDELQRDIGRHDAQIEGMERRLGNVESKLDDVLAILNQAQGSWKTMVAAGAAIAAVGGFVGWVVHFFVGR